MNKNKETVITLIIVVALLVGALISGSGDYQVASAEQCWNQTHSQACANN